MKRRRLFTDLCGGIVDISNETLVTSSIKQDIQYGQKLCSYYSIFGNTMEAIARNSGAEVVENMGGEVIFFFPKTSDTDKTPFKDVLKCGLAMQAAHDDMNQKYYEEGLPPINYRISADYGKHQVAILNICVKLYRIAPPNRMVIGENLYYMISDSFECDYHFTKIHEYHLDKNAENPYSVYLISRNG